MADLAALAMMLVLMGVFALLVAPIVFMLLSLNRRLYQSRHRRSRKFPGRNVAYPEKGLNQRRQAR